MSKVQWEQEDPRVTKIKVIGVGGGGCNAVEDMIEQGFTGVEFFGVNTDFQALMQSKIPNKVQIGEEITHGLGAGAIPELGEQAARAAEDQLRSILEGTDMVFITAGMGGGTGTGAAPIIAEVAREMNILCVSIVTKPFTFEGPQRMKRAHQGLVRLREHIDTLIVILNDKLMETVGPKVPLTEAFRVANGVLAQGIRAISDLISKPGLINVDFRDVRTVMSETGGAVMGVGLGKGENRASEAVKKACNSPLQEKIVIDGARGVLINVTGGADLTMYEINEATSLIYEKADPGADIIFGVVIDENMRDEMRVTIIATGTDPAEMTLDDFQANAGQIKPRQSDFMKPPEGALAGGGAVPAGPNEPDPRPAIARRSEPEPASPPPPEINWKSDENPLKDWEDASSAEPAAEAGSQPVDAVPGQQEGPPVPDESEPETPGEAAEGPAEDAPYYDIPAIKRRKHMFED